MICSVAGHKLGFSKLMSSNGISVNFIYSVKANHDQLITSHLKVILIQEKFIMLVYSLQVGRTVIPKTHMRGGAGIVMSDK